MLAPGDKAYIPAILGRTNERKLGKLLRRKNGRNIGRMDTLEKGIIKKFKVKLW